MDVASALGAPDKCVSFDEVGVLGHPRLAVGLLVAGTAESFERVSIRAIERIDGAACTTHVETRADALEGMPDAVTTRLTPVPEEAVRAAPAGSAFVVLTHDHALDFLIVGEALKRPDAAYIGMIGSKTKKATFRNWFLKTAGGTEEEFARLVSPIGGGALRDKRPAVIAALAAAEIMTALAMPE